MKLIGVSKHSCMELLLHVCVLGRCVKMYFITAGPSPKSFKHTNLRQLFSYFVPYVMQLLLLFHLHPTYSCFLIMLFSYLSPPYVCQEYPKLLLSLWGQQDWAFLIFFKKDNGKYLSYLWLEEHQKHYTAFNYANLDHFLLTA